MMKLLFSSSSFSFSFYDIFDVYDALCMCHDALMKQALLLAEREVDRQGIGKNLLLLLVCDGKQRTKGTNRLD